MEQEHFALGGFPRAQAEAPSRGSIPLRTRRTDVGREVSEREHAATVRPVVSATPAQLASVAVGRPVRGEFTYLVPEALAGNLAPGQRVLVPFGRGMALGFYLGPANAPVEGGVRLKPIQRVLEDSPSLPKDLIALLRFTAEHYRYPLGEVIRGALPPGLSTAVDEKEAKPDIQFFVEALVTEVPPQLARAPAQVAVLQYLLAVGGRAPLDEVTHAIPGARETLKKLATRKFVKWVEVTLQPGVREGLVQNRPDRLTPEQALAVKELQGAVDAGGFQPYLLHGVTGSGKTEVYLRAVEHTLARGLGSLVLVPEIALTPQLVGRFRSRFGGDVAVLHSGLKDRERLFHWQALRKGTVKIAVGVRSAVFAPVEHLGLIVVDEEHDPSFKQDEKLRYQARDLAVVRGKQASAVVVLGSATPSLETLQNTRSGRYKLIELKNRVDDRPMPTISLVDLRVERPREGQVTEEAPILSPQMLQAMEETVAKGQQVILFLNRRGHSTILLCEVCGLSLKCQDCDVCMTHHRSQNRVVCHYCGVAFPVPDSCRECTGPLLKLGIGTERVEAEVLERMPHARVARLDRDSATSAEKLTELLASFARRELDVLVGTQMVAKGHDFPGVTLVCVVMADTSLAIPDFRAAERTFHLLTQVAGRAGRGKDPGRVLVQTYNPDAEPVKRMLAHDFDGFSKQELEWRKALAYPPFARMASVRLEGEHPEQTAGVARFLGNLVGRHMPPASAGVRLLGPALAPIARIRGKTRWQLLLKAPTHAALAPLLARLEAALADVPNGVKVVIDVDPGAML
ncbi:primosomal protein N' [Corallococcus exiguus]|uniref:Replication restart protein PriA n=1 Tax=Corallococcus exiguus TaxID=83462 RepID=A0A7X4Y668_9BACT|nr:primosomal protein N' [Corallococcus exiguus]NBC39400.1 primosomal protein N' [Corallococcus exiguus]NNC18849.1 primosomal protein N' [Corallococcus exiguus]TNV63036.1 primosomal protein N' [Corallococcus exiguus]